MLMKLLYYLTAIVFLTFSSCGGQEKEKSEIFPFLDSTANLRLNDKKEIRQNVGCFIEHSTVGETELQRILNDTSISMTDKSKLIEYVLTNKTLYHLHKLAGNTIQGNDSLKASIESKTSNDYLKLRTILTIEDENFTSGGDFHDLKTEKINEILTHIENPRVYDSSKKYFIEVLYTLTSKAETGKSIVEQIAKLSINDSLKLYSSQLFEIFEKYKPVYEHLNSIHTWKEMDKNKELLENLFSCNQPIMFFQILSQNPSTVLESKKLSTLKNNAILNILSNSKPKTFFNDLRIFYLVQFLLDNNYSIRFLEKIIKENERVEYVNKLERE
jgi:hypothetical protein